MIPPFAQTLLLLAAAVFVVGGFQRFRLPSSLGYLLVGAIVGPHALALVTDDVSIRVLAEFGIVFLLFTIGLNFSLPQIYALRHTVLGLGTGQVVLTTLAIGAAARWIGLPWAAALAVGAVFAQSSTTIIARQLAEQKEENSRHGRMAVAMSVFQDVTAAPLVIVIPVLGAAAAAQAGTPLVMELAVTLGRALLAFAAVYLAGRFLLRRLFRAVAARRSSELFTLSVLLVALAAAGATQALGLSLAFGAFLGGMMLGETEFRHQLEASIRPFRDVLLGLFFISIGMLFDAGALAAVWHWALLGAMLMLVVKAVLVFGLVRAAGNDARLALKTGIALAVGGEFGFALLSLALEDGLVAPGAGQAVLTAVLLSMIAGPFLIRFAEPVATMLLGARARGRTDAPRPEDSMFAQLEGHVIVCGFGRIGQNVARFLEEERLPYVALDLDPERVREAHAAGEPVYYGDSSDRTVLESVGLARARLVVVSHDDTNAAVRLLGQIRGLRDDLPVMVRTRDESGVEELMRAGATEVVPETLEAGVMLATHALVLLDVPLSHIVRRVRDVRTGRYRLMKEFFRGAETAGDGGDRLHAVPLVEGAAAVGRTIADLGLAEGTVVVTALLREGRRTLTPPPQTRLQADDVVVLFGDPDDLQRAERVLLG